MAAGWETPAARTYEGGKHEGGYCVGMRGVRASTACARPHARNDGTEGDNVREGGLKGG